MKAIQGIFRVLLVHNFSKMYLLSRISNINFSFTFQNGIFLSNYTIKNIKKQYITTKIDFRLNGLENK